MGRYEEGIKRDGNESRRKGKWEERLRKTRRRRWGGERREVKEKGRGIAALLGVTANSYIHVLVPMSVPLYVAVSLLDL